jgi:hypothetical protein
MRKKQLAILSLLAVFIFTATTAFAAMGIKSITTSIGTPIATGASSASTLMASDKAATSTAAASSSCVAPSSLQLAICFALVRVGKADVDVTVSLKEKITTVCSNPAGHQTPGKVVTRTVSVSEKFPSDKNGNVTGTIITPVPGTISSREAGCPNNTWTAKVVAVDFHGQPLDFAVEQNGALALAQSYILP